MTLQKTAASLTDWIHSTVTGAGSKGVVFGMSGGIDSAVVAVLCKRAFPENCLGLIMPCHSAGDDRSHAEEVAHKFTIPFKVLDLGPTYDILTEVLQAAANNPPSDRLEFAGANIKPRLRMTALYYFASLYKYMVAGSGNRSEIAVGYFTKYGDGGVDIMPIAGLLKKQVVALAKYLEIPQEIINKPPSAGLWLGQTDESEMGITYSQLDAYLEDGSGPRYIGEKIENMMKRSIHKRFPPVSPPQKNVPGGIV